MPAGRSLARGDAARRAAAGQQRPPCRRSCPGRDVRHQA